LKTKGSLAGQLLQLHRCDDSKIVGDGERLLVEDSFKEMLM
jgi:hypothetical protein